jgi:hypothetical protein
MRVTSGRGCRDFGIWNFDFEFFDTESLYYEENQYKDIDL